MPWPRCLPRCTAWPSPPAWVSSRCVHASWALSFTRVCGLMRDNTPVCGEQQLRRQPERGRPALMCRGRWHLKGPHTASASVQAAVGVTPEDVCVGVCGASVACVPIYVPRGGVLPAPQKTTARKHASEFTHRCMHVPRGGRGAPLGGPGPCCRRIYMHSPVLKVVYLSGAGRGAAFEVSKQPPCVVPSPGAAGLPDGRGGF